MRGICNTCQFYTSHNFKATARIGGNCNRYPKFERKNDKDWCGEHKKKQKLKETAT